MTDRDEGPSRRKVLECMTWVGTGVLWSVSGGVPHSLGIIDEALAAEITMFSSTVRDPVWRLPLWRAFSGSTAIWMGTPISLSTVTVPWRFFTMPYTIASPKPVPLPTSS